MLTSVLFPERVRPTSRPLPDALSSSLIAAARLDVFVVNHLEADLATREGLGAYGRSDTGAADAEPERLVEGAKSGSSIYNHVWSTPPARQIRRELAKRQPQFLSPRINERLRRN
jgi:hypothetical protein